jgi:hypothetical protein
MKRKIKTRTTLAKRIAAQQDTRSAMEVAQHGRALTPLERAIKFQSVLGKKAVLDALDLNADSLRAAASAMDMFKQPDEMDQLRANILALKGVLDDCGKTMEIKRLAQLLEIPESVDGYSYLRSICRELRFPIKIAKRGPIKGK